MEDIIPLGWIEEALSLSTNEEKNAKVLELCETEHEVRVFKKILGLTSTTVAKKGKKVLHEGIFEHYISTIEKELGNSTASKIRDTILSTRRRMELRAPSKRSNSYGMIVGRIQSGKTAHLIGTICHAMDPLESKKEIFDTVIVLSGLIDDLRKQTYDRFFQALQGFSGDAPLLLPDREADIGKKSVEHLIEIKDHFQLVNNKSAIIVIKKNHLVLDALLSINLTRPLLNNRRILIIDDEADHASIDTSQADSNQEGEEIDEDPSRTNQLLRTMIKNFSKCSRCWYIGYTATPYANLLIRPNKYDNEDEFGMSLFPRDLLHALPKNTGDKKNPKGHLDNQYYFNTPNNPNVVIRNAPLSNSPEEVVMAREMLLRHIITEMIKKADGVKGHHTTLVHTAINVVEHQRITELMKDEVNYCKVKEHSDYIYSKMKNHLNDYQLEPEIKKKIEDELNNIFHSEHDKLLKILDKIRIVEVNARKREDDEISLSDLDYNDKFPRSYIAIGGTRLSRGLTLEGLTTTWFTRVAKIPVYDTMLQMSRWCGYRPNYDHLVRIFTTGDIRDYYQRIADVETQVRHRIESMPENENPLETLIWIGEHPGMLVTSEMKMDDVQRRHWGGVNMPILWTYETPYFHSNPSSTVGNINKAAKNMILSMGCNTKFSTNPLSGHGSFKLALDRPQKMVRKFLQTFHSEYDTSDNSPTLTHLRELVDNQWPDIDKWNVAIHTPKKGKSQMIGKFEIGLVQRKTDFDNRFSIVQSGENDVIVDCPPGFSRDKPLLILYFLDPDSTTNSSGKTTRVFDKSINTAPILLGVILPDSMLGEGGTEIASKR
jgi:hypothetical protein